MLAVLVWKKEDIIRYVEIDMNDAVKYPDHTVTNHRHPRWHRYTIEKKHR